MGPVFSTPGGVADLAANYDVRIIGVSSQAAGSATPPGVENIGPTLTLNPRLEKPDATTLNPQL